MGTAPSPLAPIWKSRARTGALAWRERTGAVAGLVALVSACGSSSSPSPSPAPSDGAAPPPAGWMAAVGGQGTFAQTFDGSTWTTRSIAVQDLYSVTCVGNLDGWAAGAGGTVAHTIDGGWAWAIQDAHTSADVRSIRFGTATLGLLAGDAGTLAVTQDGGTTWTTVAPPTASALHGVALAAAEGVMLAVGDGGIVLRSADSGATWTSATIAGAGDLQSVAMDPAAHLVLAADGGGAVWSSSDAGLHARGGHHVGARRRGARRRRQRGHRNGGRRNDPRARLRRHVDSHDDGDDGRLARRRHRRRRTPVRRRRRGNSGAERQRGRVVVGGSFGHAGHAVRARRSLRRALTLGWSASRGVN